MFEKITKTINTTVTEDSFACSKCSGIFFSEEEARKHYGLRHSFLMEEDLSIGKAIYVLTKDDLTCHLSVYDCNVREISEYVEYPGWFVIEFDTQPCPRSCCRDSVVRAIPLQEMEDRYFDKIKNCNAVVEEIQKLGQRNLDNEN